MESFQVLQIYYWILVFLTIFGGIDYAQVSYRLSMDKDDPKYGIASLLVFLFFLFGAIYLTTIHVLAIYISQIAPKSLRSVQNSNESVKSNPGELMNDNQLT